MHEPHPSAQVLLHEWHEPAPGPHVASGDLGRVLDEVLGPAEHARGDLHRELVGRQDAVHRIAQLRAPTQPSSNLQRTARHQGLGMNGFIQGMLGSKHAKVADAYQCGRKHALECERMSSSK